MPHDPFAWIAIAGAAFAAPILIWYLVRRPTTTRAAKVLLLLGIGVFPLLTAGSGNYAGFEATKSRRFCGSCHVMTPYAADSMDPNSTSLAAIHGRNQAFGAESCYTCHADYGMFGTVVTKMGGMRHVYEYTFHYRNMSLAEAREKIRIRKPFPSSTCIRCHSTSAPQWSKVPDHAGLVDELRTGAVSCLGAGCHGPSHPFSKGAPAVAP